MQYTFRSAEQIGKSDRGKISAAALALWADTDSPSNAGTSDKVRNFFTNNFIQTPSIGIALTTSYKGYHQLPRRQLWRNRIGPAGFCGLFELLEWWLF
jgi:hypothetical protein